jgi:hypothetical protein
VIHEGLRHSVRVHRHHLAAAAACPHAQGFEEGRSGGERRRGMRIDEG